MNLKKRIMTVLHGEKPNIVPWVVYQGIVPTGFLERKLRDNGMALCQWPSIFWTETPSVKVENRVEGRTTHITYHTPVGKVHSTTRFTSLGRGVGTTWVTERVMKSVQDYEVVKYIIKDIVYHYDPEPLLEAQRWLGDDGIVRAWVEISPLQQMLKTYLGPERFFVDLNKHPKEFNDLYQAIKDRAEESYRMAANSPAEVICAGENIDGVLTNPRLFEKYCLPFYNEMGHVLHQKGKIFLVHMDGRLNCLKNLISRIDIDGVEAFTPPPVGDLPIEEARALWGKKIIWANFPETVFLLGREATTRFTRELLKSVAPGENFIFGITEDIHPDYIESGLSAITETINKYGKYPISTHR